MRTARCNFIEGHNGVNAFSFQGKTKSGQRIAVEVKPVVVKELARLMDYSDSPGHVVWHYTESIPTEPCSACTKTGDPVRAALFVMVTNVTIRAFLEANDPMALKQALKALSLTKSFSDGVLIIDTFLSAVECDDIC